jgi:hypothetical protein
MKITHPGKNSNVALSGRFVMSNVAFWDQDSKQKVHYTVFSPSEFCEEQIGDGVRESLYECAQVRTKLTNSHATHYDLQTAFQKAMESRGFQAHVAHERSFDAMAPSLTLN